MAISLKHKFNSSVPEPVGPDFAGLVKPSNWNDEHDLIASDGAVLVGTGVGVAEVQIGDLGDYHDHAIAGVTGLQAALDGKAALAHSHTASNVTDFAEAVDDRVATLLTAGANVTLTYNDGAGTLEISSTGGGGGSVSDGDKGDVVVSGSGTVWNLENALKNKFAVTPADFGAVGDGTTNDRAALQDFWDYVFTNKPKYVDCTGRFAIDATVYIGLVTATQNYEWSGNIEVIDISAGGITGPMLHMRNLYYWTWHGAIHVVGKAGTAYASRPTRHGVYATGCMRGKLTGGGFAQYFSGWCLWASSNGGNNNFVNWGKWVFRDGGSGHETYSLETTFSSVTRNGSSGAVSQTTTLSGIASMPPTWIDTDFPIGSVPFCAQIIDPRTVTGITNANPAVVTTSSAHGFVNGEEVVFAGVTGFLSGSANVLNGEKWIVANATSTTFEIRGLDSTAFTAFGGAGTVDLRQLHIVTAINRGAATVNVFPWVHVRSPSATVRWFFGGGFYANGGDCGEGVVEAEGQRCGWTVLDASLYGQTILTLGAQACGVGYGRGLNSSGSAVGATLNGFYPEVTTFDIVKVSSNAIFDVSGLYPGVLSKIEFVSKPRLTSERTRYGSGGQLGGVTLDYRGDRLEFDKSAENTIELFSAATVTIDGKNKRQTYKRDSWTITLGIDMARHHLCGYDSMELCLIGSGGNNQPTGSFTFNPPNGATVNGASSYVVSGFTGPATFAIYYQYDANNFVVAPVNEPATDVQIYTTTGAFTWTKPAWADATSNVTCYLLGGGGGGGSGRLGAAASIRCGGGGGASGAFTAYEFKAGDLGATVAGSVGVGGTGGAAQSTASTNGTNGAAGGATNFGTARALGGSGGAGGTATTGAGGAAVGSATYWTMAGVAGASASTTGAAGVAGTAGPSVSGGGGSGAGLTSANAAAAGGAGGTASAAALTTTAATGGTAGTSGGGTGGNGSAFTYLYAQALGSGGGGGGSNAATAGGAGGNGGGKGAGGGGGAGALDGTSSGKGGDGSPGWAIVVTRR